jgi:hypothetical protein
MRLFGMQGVETVSLDELVFQPIARYSPGHTVTFLVCDLV